MTTADWILALTILAILLAPLVALWIGGILQRRSDSLRSKVQVFATLIAQRHDPTSPEAVRALNLIDAAFADDREVREAWTRYYTALNDPALNQPTGFSMRNERGRDLLLAMVKALKLSKKISSADLLRTYLPAIYAETSHVATLERLHRISVLEADLTQRGVPFTPWRQINPAAPVAAPLQNPAPAPAPRNGAQPGV